MVTDHNGTARDAWLQIIMEQQGTHGYRSQWNSKGCMVTDHNETARDAWLQIIVEQQGMHGYRS